MHPLHEYVAAQTARALKARRVVVWYDPSREFAPFVKELRGADAADVATVRVGDGSARLAEFRGSYFELRALVEPFVAADLPDATILYLPGCERDAKGSVLMELEKAGHLAELTLRSCARSVLLERYTLGTVDELIPPDRAVSYEDLARLARGARTVDAPSVLKVIFHDAPGDEALLAAWIASDRHDDEIAAKGATAELVKLARSALGLALPEDGTLARLRANTLRYVLAGEFRADLRCAAPPSVEAVPSPPDERCLKAVRELAKRLRSAHAKDYPALANRVEEELGLARARIDPEALGAIDTFSFEERALLAWCGELLGARRFDEATAVVEGRAQSFWLDRDVARRAQWEACRLLAELGRAAVTVRAALASMGSDPSAWVQSYAANNGWHRMDGAQRRLEALVATLDDEPEERALAAVRLLYEETCHAMTVGFTKALAARSWVLSSPLHQTGIFSEVVAERPKPVAYVLVDAMRFEMGVELSERLPQAAEVSVRHAVGVLPSITTAGMAALMPGASGSFSVEAQGATLGARIDDVFLPHVIARKKFAASRVPKLADLTLDEVLSLQPSRLRQKIHEATVVIVRSQEIDAAGENGSTTHARQVMDTVISNVARAIGKLAKVGVEHAVVTADHGHLFFATDRDESMKVDAPGGEQVELHRRCWIGRGGATPPGCVRVAASALGYASDLEFVFPAGCGLFRANGDLAFHHGGPSLQEIIVPVVTVRSKAAVASRAAGGGVSVSGAPSVVTNRVISVTLSFGAPALALGGEEKVVRPLLVSGARQVGAVGMAVNAGFDRATGCVTFPAGRPVSVGFLLNDDTVDALRIVVQDPATDAELYRSPDDIPVRLGV